MEAPGDGPIFRHAMRACPWCSRDNDSESAIKHTSPPAPGDACLCWGCGQWQIWEKAGMRRPTEQEAAELAGDVQCRRMVAAWQQLSPIRRNNPTQ